MYLGLKLLHIFLVIVAVGFNISYGILLSRAAREPEHLGHVLRTIKFLDDRFANPAYGLALVTGLAMTFVAGIPLTTFWIAAALVLFVVLVLMGVLLFSPTLRKQIELYDSHGAQSPEYQAVARRGQIIGISFAIPILIILYLMVSKPQPM
jgi:uncharacterized membrane protein